MGKVITEKFSAAQAAADKLAAEMRATAAPAQPAEEKPKRTRAAAAPAPTTPQAPTGQTTALVPVYGAQHLPAAFAAELEANAGLGCENVTAEDLSIPFLAIIQSNSPQIQKGNAKFIDGAEMGDYFDTTTGELWAGADGVDVIPLSYEVEFVEWKPRSAGGGFVRRHDARPDTVRDPQTGKDRLPNGNELVESARFFALAKGDAGWKPVVISFASTQRKKARRWVSTIMSQKLTGARGPYIAPMCAFSYRLSTALEQNDRGAWYGFVIGNGQLLTEPGLFKSAVEFTKTVRAGQFRVEGEGGEATGDAYADPKSGFAPETAPAEVPI